MPITEKAIINLIGIVKWAFIYMAFQYYYHLPKMA